MADIKKYLDSAALSELVIQIKSEDAKTLTSAQNYADGLATNYDAAGSAATAEQNAKDYTDELANGQVKINKEDIATLKGSVTTEGSVAKAIADAKATIDEDVDAVEAKADKNAEDIASINNETTGILAQAKSYADGKASEVQENVDGLSRAVADLDTYVGDIPADEQYADISTVIGYVNKKAEETLSAAQGGSSETAASVKAALDTYKTENNAKVDKNTEDIGTLQTELGEEVARATRVEGGLETRLKAVEDDYLKGADKTELQGNINTVSAALERLTNGVSADEVDGVNDLIQYVKDHGTEVTGMQEDISDNADAIAGVAGRMTTAEGKITDLETASALHAEKTYVDEQVQALQGVDTGLSNRITAIENKFGEGDGSVEDLIADAKQEAIDTAAGDATSKANAAETAAKGHADSLNTAMNTRVEALEAIDHSHANQAELDLIASGDKAKWDAAAGKAHEHGNKAVIDGITAEKVAAWDAAEANAKSHADGLNTTMQGTVDSISGRVGALETTITEKADQDDLDDAVARIAANETAIAANATAINSFTAITADEVRAFFA